MKLFYSCGLLHCDYRWHGPNYRYWLGMHAPLWTDDVGSGRAGLRAVGGWRAPTAAVCALRPPSRPLSPERSGPCRSPRGCTAPGKGADLRTDAATSRAPRCGHDGATCEHFPSASEGRTLRLRHTATGDREGLVLYFRRAGAVAGDRGPEGPSCPSL